MSYTCSCWQIGYAVIRTMASTSDRQEDKQLTCSICIETYTQPRYLPTCGHTFCENCLFTYTHNAQQDASVGEGSKFACPVCRKPHDLPEDAEVTLEWIQTLPLNTVINKMVETLENKKDTTYQQMCEPCETEGEQIVGVKLCCDCGETLCKDCTKSHRKFKMSKHHKLIDLDDLPKQDSRVNLFSGVSMCSNHSKWELNMYCKSHSSVICAACITTDHRDCNVMQFTSHDIDTEKLESDSEKVHTQMKASIGHLVRLQTIRDENKKSIKRKMSEIRENTEQKRARLDQLMENVVKHVRDVTKQVEYETESTLDRGILRITKLKQETGQEYVRLDTAGKHGSERHKFVSVQQIKTLCEKFEKDISKEDALMKTIEVELKLSDDIGKLLEHTDVEKLIKLKVEENESSHAQFAHRDGISDDWKQRPLIVNSLRNSPLVRAEKHCHTVRRNAACEPWYVEIVVLRDGHLMLIDQCKQSPDCERMCLYNPANKAIDTLNLKGASGATQIDDKHVAVSIPNDKLIIIVAIDEELRVEKTIKTKTEPCSMVALKNGQLAVSSIGPPSFSIIDISGEDLAPPVMYLEEDKNGRKFKSFFWIAVDERRQHVIQSCDVEKAVYCFDFTGEPVFKYVHPELTDPADVALDKCGNIYVCEWNSPGSIHKMSPAGEPISIFKEGVPSYPLAICYDSKGTKFWVTNGTDKECDLVIGLPLRRRVEFTF